MTQGFDENRLKYTCDQSQDRKNGRGPVIARHLFVWEDGTRLLDQTQTVVNFSGNSLKLAF